MRRALRNVGLDAVAWATIQAAAGYGLHRLPAGRLDHDTWVTRPRKWEAGGSFYVDRLRIRRWKGLLPDAGALFAGGFDKAQLGARSGEHLRRHVIETRRAEIGHWLALLPTPLFWRWNPRWLSVVMTAYALVVNGPCIAAQRYNRLRLLRVLQRLELRRWSAPHGTGRQPSGPARRPG
ncbi:MAG TPA: hypothetical protein VMZ51_08445 [Acidimicrobiales bacterium]|nr:hypothetical protein [Acidimicrobiales bacterium]